jgi:hypothetical protein
MPSQAPMQVTLVEVAKLLGSAITTESVIVQPKESIRVNV